MRSLKTVKGISIFTFWFKSRMVREDTNQGGEPKYKTHPVSGNRDFGYLTNPMEAIHFTQGEWID